MSSWKDAASRYDKEQANKQQRAADEQAARERVDAANVEEAAKADRMVQEFLQAAESVGNPGAKQYTYEERGIFIMFQKKGVKYWRLLTNYPSYPNLHSVDEVILRGLMNTSYHKKVAQGGYSKTRTRLLSFTGLVIIENGLWRYRDGVGDYDGDGSGWEYHAGRNVEGLFGNIGGDRSGDFSNSLQRLLVALMRENGIPIPS